MATDVVFIAQLAARVKRVEHGFVGIRKAADEAGMRLATPTRLTLAKQLIGDASHQVRSLGTFMLGDLASRSAPALKLLRDVVAKDDDWRVQEILAKSFDAYCAAVGYAAALPTIDAWLAHGNPNVRRAVSEGLRIWTGRPFFQDRPEEAIRRLSGLRADPSDYVRRSAGNALRDIARKHGALVRAEIATWDAEDPAVGQTLAHVRQRGGRQ